MKSDTSGIRPKLGVEAGDAPRSGKTFRPARLHALRPLPRERQRFGTLIASGLILAAGLLGTGAFFAPPLQVTSLRIEGVPNALRARAELLAQAFVRSHATLFGKPRLFLVPREALAEYLRAQLPEVASVFVMRELPGTLVLRLQEKVPVALLDLGGRRYALDGKGVVIADIGMATLFEGLPIIRDVQTTSAVHPGDTVVSPRVLDALHRIVVELPERLSVSVAELQLPAIGAEELHVRTTGGWTLLLDVLRPLDEQLRVFEHVVAETLSADELTRLETVDVRIPGKVYFRVRARTRND